MQTQRDKQKAIAIMQAKGEWWLRRGEGQHAEGVKQSDFAISHREN